MSKIVILLESMWGWGGWHEPGEEAPRFFNINRNNFSGRRLHRLCGKIPFVVTNSCRIVQASAKHHGKPDPVWVAENLKALEPFDLLLVCGKIAKTAYFDSGYRRDFSVIFIDHPAARRWTNAKLDSVAQEILSQCRESV